MIAQALLEFGRGVYRWTVDEIAVVGSELTPAGAVYTTLATFPTVPTDAA